MYAYFIGEVIDVTTNNLVLEVNHIGYNMIISCKTAEYLRGSAGETKIYTYTSVREDAFLLYGFLTKEELDMFKKLITVNGVGPKGALAILDIMSVRNLQYAILAQDAKAISKANGVGSKTAERIIIDLKDKVQIDDIAADVNRNTDDMTDEVAKKDALEALIELGYSTTEAMKAIRQCEITESDTSEDILKRALKKLTLF